MHRLRNSIIYLVIHLTVFFNIDRLDVAGKDILSLEKAVFVLTAVAIIMNLSIQWLKTLRPPMSILLWIGAYFVTKLMFIANRPLLGGIYTYLSFMELGLFLIAVILAQNLALNLEDFEQALENFAFARMFKIKQVQEAQRDIEAEIYRCRRFQRPLSIVVLEQDSKKVQADFNKVVQESQRALTERYVSGMIVRGVSAQLRETDILLEHDQKGKLIIVSPDTDDIGIEAFIGRLRLLTQSAAFSVNFGAATFPDHALTFEQLLVRAEMNLQQRVDNLVSTDSVEKIIDSSEKISEKVKVD